MTSRISEKKHLLWQLLDNCVVIVAVHYVSVIPEASHLIYVIMPNSWVVNENINVNTTCESKQLMGIPPGTYTT